MGNQYEPTTEELKRAWMHTGLAFRSHRFEEDIKIPMIANALRRAVQAARKDDQLPKQSSLLLECSHA